MLQPDEALRVVELQSYIDDYVVSGVRRSLFPELGKSAPLWHWSKPCPTQTLRTIVISHPQANLALATGATRSRIVAVDIDNPTPELVTLVELGKPIPGFGRTDTACYFTARPGIHLLYRCKRPMRKQTPLVQGVGRIEVLADGQKVTVPPSIVGGQKRIFLRGLPLLKNFEELEIWRPEMADSCPATETDPEVPDEEWITKLNPHTHRSCIWALLRSARLVQDERLRNMSLHFVGNLLTSDRHDLSYARRVVDALNEHFPRPLSGSELANIRLDGYTYSCSRVGSTFPDIVTPELCVRCAHRKVIQLRRVKQAVPVLLNGGFSDRAKVLYTVTEAGAVSGVVAEAAKALGWSESKVKRARKELKRGGLDIDRLARSWHGAKASKRRGSDSTPNAAPTAQQVTESRHLRDTA